MTTSVRSAHIEFQLMLQTVDDFFNFSGGAEFSNSITGQWEVLKEHVQWFSEDWENADFKDFVNAVQHLNQLFEEMAQLAEDITDGNVLKENFYEIKRPLFSRHFD